MTKALRQAMDTLPPCAQATGVACARLLMGDASLFIVTAGGLVSQSGGCGEGVVVRD
jgi:hypothetical protein